MRKKGNPGDGFLLCFLVNLLFNFWWGLIAVILLALHFILSIPVFWSLIGFLIWIGVAFISTALIVWAVSTAEEKTPQRENLNPYSAKNSDIFPTAETLPQAHIRDSKLDEGVKTDAGDSTDNVEKSNSGELVE